MKAIKEEALDGVRKLVTVERTGHSLGIRSWDPRVQCDSRVDQLGPSFVTQKWQQVREVPGGWAASSLCCMQWYRVPHLVSKMGRGHPQRLAPLSGIILK